METYHTEYDEATGSFNVYKKEYLVKGLSSNGAEFTRKALEEEAQDADSDPDS